MSSQNRYKSPFGLKKEMGYTKNEFYENLPGLLSHYKFQRVDNGLTIELQNGYVTLLIGMEGVRRFTEHVSFPVLPLQIQFTNAEEDDELLFLKRFDRQFMKGLG